MLEEVFSPLSAAKAKPPQKKGLDYFKISKNKKGSNNLSEILALKLTI